MCAKDKEECGSAENESDSNSTTTPKTIISGNKTGSPTASIGSDTVGDRAQMSRNPRRSITPVCTPLVYTNVVILCKNSLLSFNYFSFLNIGYQVPPITPCLQRQPSVGNVLARTSSFGSSGSNSSGPPSGNNRVQRQGSQGSIFEQFACQAKELVRETTRQSSQDGLLAQMDKVQLLYFCFVFFLILMS